MRRYRLPLASFCKMIGRESATRDAIVHASHEPEAQARSVGLRERPRLRFGFVWNRVRLGSPILCRSPKDRCRGCGASSRTILSKRDRHPNRSTVRRAPCPLVGFPPPFAVAIQASRRGKNLRALAGWCAITGKRSRRNSFPRSAWECRPGRSASLRFVCTSDQNQAGSILPPGFPCATGFASVCGEPGTGKASGTRNPPSAISGSDPQPVPYAAGPQRRRRASKTAFPRRAWERVYPCYLAQICAPSGER